MLASKMPIHNKRLLNDSITEFWRGEDIHVEYSIEPKEQTKSFTNTVPTAQIEIFQDYTLPFLICYTTFQFLMFY